MTPAGIDNTSETARLFTALWLPPEVVTDFGEALAPARAELAAAPTNQTRMTRPETWHITLAFLGEAALDRALDRFTDIELPAAEELAIAGGGRFAAVTWAGVRHGPWLAELARRNQRALRVRDRRFHAHVTVARDRGNGRAGEESHNPVLPALAGYQGKAWLPDEVLLVRSLLGPQSRYEAVARRTLHPAS
ncbi:MAG: RNA 2',3'-cyclic phosphodiesterase [Candidatus Nanopelagicales bacterium]